MISSKKILILSANPKDTARLRLDEEVREIEDGLRRSKYRDRFIIQSKWAVRLRDLRRAILDTEPQIIHFCGHGERTGLMIEDEHGKAIIINPEALSGLFELFASQIECVLLNACYSTVQAEAVNKYIPYVIGMQQGISDIASIEFVIGFYDALGAGKTIEHAFKFGCNAIQLYNIPDDTLPVLKKAISLSSQHINAPETQVLQDKNTQNGEAEGRSYQESSVHKPDGRQIITNSFIWFMFVLNPLGNLIINNQFIGWKIKLCILLSVGLLTYLFSRFSYKIKQLEQRWKY